MRAPISRFARQDAFCYSRTRATDALFRGSSVVEQPAVNRLVVGSNPTRGAIHHLSHSPNHESAAISWAAGNDRGRSVTSISRLSGKYAYRAAAPKSYHRVPAGSAFS